MIAGMEGTLEQAASDPNATIIGFSEGLRMGLNPLTTLGVVMKAFSGLPLYDFMGVHTYYGSSFFLGLATPAIAGVAVLYSLLKGK